MEIFQEQISNIQPSSQIYLVLPRCKLLGSCRVLLLGTDSVISVVSLAAWLSIARLNLCIKTVQF